MRGSEANLALHVIEHRLSVIVERAEDHLHLGLVALLEGGQARRECSTWTTPKYNITIIKGVFSG